MKGGENFFKKINRKVKATEEFDEKSFVILIFLHD